MGLEEKDLSLTDITMVGLLIGCDQDRMEEGLDVIFDSLSLPVTNELLSTALVELPSEDMVHFTQKGLRALLEEYHRRGGQRYRDVV